MSLAHQILDEAPRTGSRRFWTTREERILREHYPTGGLAACRPLLPGRGDGSIYQHAGKLGLRSPVTHDFRRKRWESNDIIDQMIRRAYEATPRKGFTRDLARRTGRPAWWCKKRAQRLGLVAPRFKESPWSETEIALVTESAHRHPDVIARKLKRAGFTRTPTAILVKLKRLRADRTDPNHYTGRGLASLMGVDAKTVTGWIDKGWLKARRRGTARTEAQGGDEHWIKRRDVRTFIVENAAAVDLRKVDKFWFIDLLAGCA